MLENLPKYSRKFFDGSPIKHFRQSGVMVTNEQSGNAQAVVRFLWDAHNCEEAREEEELVVSTPYIEHWNELIDLWYLGMQVWLYHYQFKFNIF